MAYQKYNVQSPTPNLVIVQGRWVGGSSSATTKETGDGWTIATGAGSGVYTITLDRLYTAIESFVATVHANAPGDVDNPYTVHLDTNASDGDTLVFTVSAAGTPTDLAAAQHMSFMCLLTDGTI